MKRRRVLAVALLLLLVGGTFAVLRNTVFRPAGPPSTEHRNGKEAAAQPSADTLATTLEAWNRGGFETAKGSWTFDHALFAPRRSDGYSVENPNLILKLNGSFSKARDGTDLPDFTFPFALDLADPPLPATAFKRFAGLKNLVAVHLTQEQVTDDVVKGLAEAGLLRCLGWKQFLDHGDFQRDICRFLLCAKASDDQRAHTDEEIVSLNLSYTSVTDAGLAYLAGLKNLHTLRLNKTEVKGPGLKHLAALENLAVLDLSRTRVTDEALEHLAGVKNLTQLVLYSTGTKDAGLRHLAGLTRLDTLSFDDGQLTDRGLAALAEAGLLHTIGSRAELPQAPGLPSRETPGDDKRPTGPEEVVSLKLYPPVTAKALRHLGGLKSLTCLQLTDPYEQLTDEAMDALAEIGLLHALHPHAWADHRRPTRPEEVVTFKHKSLAGGWKGKITGRSLRHLAGFKNLTLLDASDFLDVTDADLKPLSTLEHLTVLTLESRLVTDEGLKHLTGLSKLETLRLGSTAVTNEGVKKLQQALPNCKIARY